MTSGGKSCVMRFEPMHGVSPATRSLATWRRRASRQRETWSSCPRTARQLASSPAPSRARAARRSCDPSVPSSIHQRVRERLGLPCETRSVIDRHWRSSYGPRVGRTRPGSAWPELPSTMRVPSGREVRPSVVAVVVPLPPVSSSPPPPFLPTSRSSVDRRSSR